MVFSSISFLLYFLPILLALYFAVPSRTWKNGVLLVASLFFYSWGEPVWVSLLLISATVDYLCGRLIHRQDLLLESLEVSASAQSSAPLAVGDSPAVKHARTLRTLGLLMSLVINLGLLGVFKYQGFFLENLNALFSLNLPIREIALPIGISFYTFQTMSYTIDLYLGHTTVQKNFFSFLLYVSLFPQLVAGPIVRYRDIADEIEGRKESLPLFGEGVKRFIAGLAKKVVIANTAGNIAQIFLMNPSFQSVTATWAGVLFFFFQIYFDFSGYSDMAIGLGKMFGFHFKENFLHPLAASSIAEMWRRWHVSLTSFFRDYVYIPLGGNRKHHVRNLFVVWFLTGLWHGASWNFVLWGFYYGILIAVERFLASKTNWRLPWIFQKMYFWVFATLGWTFFYFTDSAELWHRLKTMFFFSGVALVDPLTIRYLAANLFFALLCFLVGTPLVRKFYEKTPLSKVPFLEEAAFLVLFVFSVILMIGQSYNPFLYFRF